MHSEKLNSSQKVQFYLNASNRILIWFVALYVTWYCLNFNRTIENLTPFITLHVWFNIIGIQLLMAESLMVFYESNVFFNLHTTKTKRIIHLLLQSIGSGFVLLGTILLYIQRLDHDHFFVSIHSITGYISCIFVFASMINGGLALWAQDLKEYVKPMYMKLFHCITGTGAFLMGMVSLFFTYNYPYFSGSHDYDIRPMLIACWAVMTPLTIIGALKTIISKLKTMLS